MDKNLNYQQARRIRGTGIGKIFADQLDQNATVGQALKRTVSLKAQAKMKGVAEKFDPLNIARFMTFGSSWAPALLGHMTGRSHEDTRYFSGRLKPIVVKSNSSKVTPLPKEGEELVEGKNVRVKGINEQLLKIYKLLDKSKEGEKKRREMEHNFDEEKSQEAERRHKEFMRVLTAITGGDTTAVQVETETQKTNPFDKLLDNIWPQLLTKVPLLGWFAAYVTVPALAGALFNQYWQNRKEEVAQANVEEAQQKGGSVAADAAAQLEAMQKEGTIDLPENEEKVKLLVQQRDDAIKRRDIFREEFYRSNGYRKKGDNFVDGKGNKPTAELMQAAEQHVTEQIDAMNRGDIKDPVGKIDQEMAKKFQLAKEGKTATPVAPTPVTTPSTASPVSNAGGGRGGQGGATLEQAAQNTALNSPKVESVVSAPAQTQKLNAVMAENVDAQLPKQKAEENVVINNVVKTAKKDNRPLDSLSELAVRNDEPTLLRMIMGSTRVV